MALHKAKEESKQASIANTVLQKKAILLVANFRMSMSPRGFVFNTGVATEVVHSSVGSTDLTEVIFGKEQAEDLKFAAAWRGLERVVWRTPYPQGMSDAMFEQVQEAWLVKQHDTPGLQSKDIEPLKELWKLYIKG